MRNRERKVELPWVLENCIERIRRGDSIESCLSECPTMRNQIEPLLHTALSISSIPKVSPSDEFRRISKGRLMIRLRKEPIENETTKSH